MNQPFWKTKTLEEMTQKEWESLCDWLPESCAYAQLARGDDLEWWHPLRTGNTDAMHDLGISARGKIDGASIANG